VAAGPPYWVHHFTIASEVDLDEELRGWLAEACRAGGVHMTHATHGRAGADGSSGEHT
jgi:hypothetical protein